MGRRRVEGWIDRMRDGEGAASFKSLSRLVVTLVACRDMIRRTVSGLRLWVSRTCGGSASPFRGRTRRPWRPYNTL